MRIRAGFFLLVCASFFASAVFVGRAELLPYLGNDIATETLSTPILGTIAGTGFSIQAQYLALTRCKDLAMSQVGQLQPSYIREPVMRDCVRLSDEVTSNSPTYAYAYLVGAMAALELGDALGMRSRLALAHKYAPTEQWIALGRVEVAEKSRLRFGGDGPEFESADIEILVHSWSGIDAIAGRYVSDPQFRDRVIEAVERLPERDQERFLQRVAAAAQRGQQ